jgi:hypothetical protein
MKLLKKLWCKLFGHYYFWSFLQGKEMEYMHIKHTCIHCRDSHFEKIYVKFD